jgi:AraC-like DNA-binding protein
MQQPLLARHRLLATSDPDEGQQFATRLWEKHHRLIWRGRYGLTWHQAGVGRSSLNYVETHCAERTACAGPQSDLFRIGFHDSGRIEHRINGHQAVSLPGRGILHAPGQDVRFESEPFRMLFLALPGEAVRKAIQRLFPATPPFETWATEFPAASAPAASLESLCRWASTELDRPASILLRSPRPGACLERTLLALFVDCLAERHPHPDQQAGNLAEAQVRLIEAWMEANLTEPIGIEEMAAAVGAHPRAVQRAFRRLRGCTPMKALRDRRLALAKRLMEQPAPETTVTSVATEIGFFHFGRFSVRYRETFGESPSATLARGCRSMG